MEVLRPCSYKEPGIRRITPSPPSVITDSRESSRCSLVPQLTLVAHIYQNQNILKLTLSRYDKWVRVIYLLNKIGISKFERQRLQIRRWIIKSYHSNYQLVRFVQGNDYLMNCQSISVAEELNTRCNSAKQLRPSLQPLLDTIKPGIPRTTLPHPRNHQGSGHHNMQEIQGGLHCGCIYEIKHENCQYICLIQNICMRVPATANTVVLFSHPPSNK